MRCLLVDDSAAFLSSAWMLLDREGVTIVATASTSAEALRLAAAQRARCRMSIAWAHPTSRGSV